MKIAQYCLTLILFSFLTISQTALAQASNTVTPDLVAQLKAYGQCIDEQNAIAKIRSDSELNNANQSCNQYLSKIRQLNADVATKLEQHMKARVSEVARNTTTNNGQ